MEDSSDGMYVYRGILDVGMKSAKKLRLKSNMKYPHQARVVFE